MRKKQTMSARFITRLRDSRWGYHERLVKKDLLEHPCSGFIIWMICTMLVAKHAHFCRCNQGIMTKCSNSECKCSIYTLDNDALWRCMIAMIVQHEDGVFHAQMKWRIWHDAFAMMLVQWCIHHDAKMMMLLMYACMRCISMMRTHMSWGCTWLAPRNRSLVTNT